MGGGGGGHIADMIARYKANMSWLKERRYFNKQNGKYENRGSDWTYDFPNPNPQYLQKLREKLILQKKHEIRKLLIILFISIIIGFSMIYWVFFMN